MPDAPLRTARAPRRRAIAVLALALLAATAPAADARPAATDPVKFFEDQVAPLLTDSCLKCHGADEAKVKGGLLLTSYANVLAGGDNGPAVDLGKPADSLLLKMISYSDDDHQMPPKTRLPADKAEILAKWVKMGAPWGRKDLGPTGTSGKAPTAMTGAKTKGNGAWSYRKAVRPGVPAVKDAAWGRTPIDAFILSALEAKGLKPAPEAERRVLIRRATYDLVGLPPTPQEVEAFARNPDPQAYDQLIDRLLASPHYGEKWGRSWLDLVGFAETNGFERDGDKPNAYRYRDYVIRALNEDKPYDLFVQEQLAGDQFEKPTADGIIASGYCRLGQWDDEPADPEQAHYDHLDGLVSTTAQAMLGMSLGCARCHNHKKDPLTQEDYYRMLAFFQGLKPMDKKGANIETAIANDAGAAKASAAKLAKLQDQIAKVEAEFTKKAGAGAPAAKDLDDLAYRFYRGAWTAIPAFDGLKAESEGKLPNGLFDTAAATREADYGFVFTGTLVVPAAGTYAFSLDADDGARLSIADKVVVDLDGAHTLGAPKRGEVALAKGRVAIRLDYFQGSADRGLVVAWEGPGVAKRLLSARAGETGLAEQIAARGPEVLGKDAYAKYVELVSDVASLKAAAEGAEQGGMALSAVEGELKATFVLKRGNPHVPGAKVTPGFPKVLGGKELPAQVVRPRLQLAAWIGSADNPLTSRVMANRLWQYHFGRGLVATSNDFGGFGELPSNQRLLDWLACELVARGWKLKAMHRLIMASSAYRMASKADADGLAKDPTNTLQWRFAMRRLTAEEVRDSVLAVDGTLNLAMGGPDIYPPLSQEVLSTQSDPGQGWGKSSPEEAARRSVYIKIKRSLIYPLLAVHDSADTEASCPVRFSSTVPTQALTMMNSGFLNEEAAHLAARVQREASGDQAQQVRYALQLVTQRPPGDDDVKRGLAFLQKAGGSGGFQTFCLLLLNLNEFVYLD